MFDLLESKRHLSLLPNWAYGVALAKFHLSLEAKGEDTAATLRESSDALLQEALLMFPSALNRLLDKCSVDAADGVTKHKFFLEAELK